MLTPMPVRYVMRRSRTPVQFARTLFELHRAIRAGRAAVRIASVSSLPPEASSALTCVLPGASWRPSSPS